MIVRKIVRIGARGWFVTASDDPSVVGLDLPLDSVAVALADGVLYQKVGTGDTDWEVMAESDIDAALAAHVAASDPHTQYQRESEKGAANGYASLGSGGYVPVGQLGSGTPDNTMFLRGDGTWQATTSPSFISGGGTFGAGDYTFPANLAVTNILTVGSATGTPTGQTAIGRFGGNPIFVQRTANGFTGVTLESAEYVFFGESTDAVIALASQREGSHGSGLQLMEMNASALVDYWWHGKESSNAGIAGRTNEESALAWTYGTTDAAYGTAAALRMELTRFGQLVVGGAAAAKVYSTVPGLFISRSSSSFSDSFVDPFALAGLVLISPEGRAQLIGDGAGNNNSMLILSAGSAATNKHWLLHHRGSGQSNVLAIQYNTTTSDSDVTTGATTFLTCSTAGMWAPGTTNSYDWGASGATWRTGYFGTSVVVGTYAASALLGNTARVHIEDDGNGIFMGIRYGAEPTFRLTRANGTSASPTAIASGNVVSSMRAAGYVAGTTNNFTDQGRMGWVALQSWTDSVRGAYWFAETTPTGSATAVRFVTGFGVGALRVGSTASTTAPAQAGYYGTTDNAEDIYESGTRARTVYGYIGDFATTVGVGIGVTTANSSAPMTVNAGTNAGANDKDAYYGVQRGGTALWRMGVLGSVSADANWTLRDVVNGSSAIVITPSTLAAVFGGSIKTATPSGGTAAAWKFGSRVAATVALDTTQYIELDVGGTLYKVGIVT